MKKKRKYEWLISPDQATETNDKVSAYLWQEGLITESQSMDLIKVDGKPVHGWKVPHRVITQMEKASKVFTFIKFRAFVKRGKGKWRENFLHLEQWRSIHYKKAQKRLKEIVARKK